jgi:hypothetical protein
MTIQNKKAFLDALWDWGFLDECFARGIRISDIDGAVERNGHLLFIEAKPLGKQLSTGQSIMFSQLASNGFTVLILWGECNKPVEMMIWIPHQANPLKKRDADEAKVKEFVRKWFTWADQVGPKRKLDKKRKWPLTLDLTPNANS